MQVEVGEVAEDLVEDAGLVQAGDLVVEVVLLEHLDRTGREGVDISDQRLRDVLVVSQQRREGQRRGVVELLAGDLPQDGVDVAEAGRLELDGLRQDRGLRGLEDSVQSAQHQKGEHDRAVLVRLEVPAELVRDLPDEGDLVGEAVRLVAHSRPPPRVMLGAY